MANSKIRPRSCFRFRVMARLLELIIVIGKVVLFARRRAPAQGFALGRLDLDHIGAGLRHQQGRVRPLIDLPEIEHDGRAAGWDGRTPRCCYSGASAPVVVDRNAPGEVWRLPDSNRCCRHERERNPTGRERGRAKQKACNTGTSAVLCPPTFVGLRPRPRHTHMTQFARRPLDSAGCRLIR
jgi:hypothetical protein